MNKFKFNFKKSLIKCIKIIREYLMASSKPSSSDESKKKIKVRRISSHTSTDSSSSSEFYNVRIMNFKINKYRSF